MGVVASASNPQEKIPSKLIVIDWGVANAAVVLMIARTRKKVMERVMDSTSMSLTKRRTNLVSKKLDKDKKDLYIQGHSFASKNIMNVLNYILYLKVRGYK